MADEYNGAHEDNDWLTSDETDVLQTYREDKATHSTYVKEVRMKKRKRDYLDAQITKLNQEFDDIKTGIDDKKAMVKSIRRRQSYRKEKQEKRDRVGVPAEFEDELNSENEEPEAGHPPPFPPMAAAHVLNAGGVIAIINGTNNEINIHR